MRASADSPLPVDLYRAADVREMDRRAIEEHGLGDGALMERAGAAAFAAMRRRWPAARRIGVVAGGGNNGGDGYVLVRLARAHGLNATVFALREPKAGGDAARAAARFAEAGGRVKPFMDFADGTFDLVVDALMGTGLDRDLQGDFARTVEAINANAAPCFAIDIPSGLHADSGAVMGCAVRAAATITFIGAKCGLFTGRGPVFTGAVDFAGLDVPASVRDGLPPAARRVTEADLRAALPPRERDAHKGKFGHVLIAGGDLGMPGAVRMAAEAALRSGAGLVSVYTRPAHVAAVVGTRPELMCHGGDDADGMAELIDKATVVAVGPGLGQGDFGRTLLARAMAADKPLVVDADGLNLLAAQPAARGNWILTPHPGEAARLLGSSADNVQADRFTAAAELADRYDAVIVLKGAGTIVAAPDRTPALIDRGNPGMAAGGMGDILTGIIAAVLAQTGSPFEAACAGAFAHAAAGDRAAARGERGLAALDLVGELRSVLNP
ncbi:MAG TPA: NAD(P)H-hydrate dehydratase [Gammaproteobacteria bacterium]|nr:NAD(P)H-hydrate dehydratase [Gammaproteobacteria bacterium]